MTKEKELQEKIFLALVTDKRISAAQVVKNIAPYDGDKLPAVVYQMISDVPAAHADDTEAASYITVQVSIVSDIGEDADLVDGIEEAVQDVMLGLGFMRVSRDEITEEDKYQTIALRYRIAIMR